MAERLTYYDFAEEDKLFFDDNYQRGLRTNAMSCIAQNICERYLKHIIDSYYTPETKEEQSQKKDILGTHSLRRLMGFLQDEMNIEMSKDEYRTISYANGFYFTARYPGDDASFVKKEDVEDCQLAVDMCKEVVDKIIKSYEKMSKDAENVEKTDDDPGDRD